MILIGLSGYPLVAWADNTSVAQAEPPPAIIQTSVRPQNPVVGQQVEFQVDVFVDTWLTSAPQFPEIQVDDAIALLPPSSSVNLNQPIDGKPYAGQRRTYFLFPQRPGRYQLPELSVTVTPAQPGMAEPNAITLTTKPADFLAQLPPELAVQSRDHPILATPRLGVTTQLTTPNGSDLARLQRFHTGDTMEKMVTLTAVDTLASILPAIAVNDIPGLSIYADAPRVTNQFNRGAFTASRTERITYVAEQPGRYQLPAQSIVWWNTRTRSLQTETIPAVEIRVMPTLQQRLTQLLPGFMGLLVLIGGLSYFRRPLRQAWQNYRRRQLESEAARWQRLRRACQQNDPQAAWDGLMTWLASQNLAGAVLTLDILLNQAKDPTLDQAIQELEAVLFAPQHGQDSKLWQGQPLLTALSDQRQPLRSRSSQQKYPQTPTSLPPLNPPFTEQA